MKMKAVEKTSKGIGRPTKYSKAIQQKSDGYILDFTKTGNVIPSIEGLAQYLNVNRSTLYEWREKYPDFSDTLERIQW